MSPMAPVPTTRKQWHDRIVAELDWAELAAVTSSTDLNEALGFAPLEGLACLAAAVHEALFGSRAALARTAAELPQLQDQGRVTPRLRAGPSYMPAFTLCSAVRADNIGKLVTVRMRGRLMTPPCARRPAGLLTGWLELLRPPDPESDGRDRVALAPLARRCGARWCA